MADWLVRPRSRPDAPLRLVCVPYAGGGASAFRTWADLLGDRVELWCANLPGRERRFAEPARTDLATLAEPLTDAIDAQVRPPVVLFGHSMGALIAFETARRLAARGAAPERLFVSSAKAPHLPLGSRPDRFTDAALVSWVTRLGGAPAELLANREMLELLLPTLRADLRLCADYHGDPTVSPVDVPVTAFAGLADPLAALADVAGWARHTTAGFDLVPLPGGHFQLSHDPAPVITRVLGTADRASKEGVR